MSDIKPIESLIKQARSRLILSATAAEKAGDLVAKIDWQNRRAFLDNLLREFRERKSGRVLDRSVFISYSLNSGRVYFDVLAEKLEAAGFEVVTGFQKSPGDKGGVLSRILGQLRRSTVYLGLLTKEMRVKGPRRTEQWSPSVWTMEEKGMALALGKPFVLLVQDGIHTDYWLKTAPDKVHLTFTDESFGARVKEVVEVIAERYEEMVFEFLGQPDLPLSRHAASEGRDSDG